MPSTPVWIALLRAVNVGGRTVKMDHLRRVFESLGFWNVQTFIASGNVLFETAVSSEHVLENTIEGALREEFGFEIMAFLRTGGEFQRIARYSPFSPFKLDRARAFNIAFLKEELDAGSVAKLKSLTTSIDEFQVRGREIYWLCRKKQSESTFSNAVLEKSLGRRSTLRGAKTVYKIAEKF